MLPPLVIDQLRAVLGPSRFFHKEDQDPACKDIIEEFSRDHSEHEAHSPDCVTFPVSTEEVSSIARICYDNGVNITPVGALTGLEGSAIPNGGVSVSFRRMNQVLELIEDDFFVVVQPGVLKEELNAWLAPKGLTFYPDPASNPSVGGQASTGASGTTTLKYGTFKENVIAMTVVLPDGDVIKTRRKTRKTSTGYDLTNLFLGSEGTLGLITELCLRVGPPPHAVSAARVNFEDIGHAAMTVVDMRREGLGELARCELLNVAAINAVNKYSGTNFKAEPTLFLEFHGGNEAVLRGIIEAAREIACRNGGTNFEGTASEEARLKLWEARRNAHHAAREFRPLENGQEAVVFSTDACVPLKHLARVISETEDDFSKADVPPIIVGHVADGNFHVLAPCFPRDVATIQSLQKGMANRSLECGGTVSGEHGIGLGKKEFLVDEHGDRAVQLMRQIKDLVDPKHILNPKKVLH